jgi:hypothetical protein
MERAITRAHIQLRFQFRSTTPLRGSRDTKTAAAAACTLLQRMTTRHIDRSSASTAMHSAAAHDRLQHRPQCISTCALQLVQHRGSVNDMCCSNRVHSSECTHATPFSNFTALPRFGGVTAPRLQQRQHALCPSTYSPAVSTATLSTTCCR